MWTAEPTMGRLAALAAETTGQRHVLGRDGHTLAVDGAQVGVLEEADKVRLAGLLESTDRRRLETKIGLEVLRNLTHKTLEGKLADEQLRRLLVATDLTQSDRTRLVTVGLLH